MERAIRYLKTRFFPARTILSIESGNEALTHFLQTVAMQRSHPTQKERTVGEVFDEEKRRLLPLPKAPLPTDTVTSATADKTAFVVFDTNRYSVEPDAADRVLRLVANDAEVRLLDGDRVVGAHARCWGKNRVVEAPEHRAAVLASKPGARDGKGRDRLRAAIPRIDKLTSRWLDDGRNVGSHVARTLKLLDLYGAGVLRAAVDDLLAKDSHDYGALAILCEKRRTSPRRVLPLELAAHVVDRDVVPHDLGGYDDDGE